MQRSVPVQVEMAPEPSAAEDLRCVIEVGAAYFAAAYASLALGQLPDGMIVIWPASGIAIGLAYVLGRARLRPIAVGTFAGSLLAQIVFGRGALASVVLAIGHAAEVLLFVWLPLLLPSADGPFRRLIRLLTQAASAAVASGIATVSAALLMAGAGLHGTPAEQLWPGWLLADFVGVVVAAPLVAATITLYRALPLGHDWTIDIALLALFAFVSHSVLGAQTDSGGSLSIVPGAALLPILMWIAARTQPIVLALAIAWLAVLVMYFMLTGTGRYGDPRLLRVGWSIAGVSRT